jgi:hypothetical protein
LKETTKPIRLKNRTCIYCGRSFGNDARRTREHVIGLNFVPEKSFKANDWNLIVWACGSCNHKKAKLEGEISAITLQPSIGTAHLDRTLGSLAERKASKAHSVATGKTVRGSYEKVSLTHLLASNIPMRFDFVTLPRLLPDRVVALAGAQIHAFFYFLTYNESQGRGSFLPGGIVWSAFAQKADWGNAQFLAFALLVQGWNGRVRGNAAEDYFRIVIKRDPLGIDLWSFALEWNQNYRIIGFFGDASSAAVYVAGFLSFEWMGLGETARMREETPLNSSRDVLFACQFDEEWIPKAG